MPYYSRIILNSFYNRLFPKLFQHNRRMPIGVKAVRIEITKLMALATHSVITVKHHLYSLPYVVP